jgi:ATP-dependent DNA ligase
MEGLWQGASAPKRQSAASSQRLKNSLYVLVSTAASRPIVKISSYSGFTHHDCNRRALMFYNDLLRWKDRDVTGLSLIERRGLLKSLVVIRDKRISITDYFEAAPKDLLPAVREQGLEGIVGKQKDSHYQPGKRSGAWIKLSRESRARVCYRRLFSRPARR